ncbi:MAG: acyl carrier protein [Eubacteriales bacterium]|jgi:D-alanine--poly(phosphoribitol) ligase subunit 2|nr:acyl carrier protein [Clostridiales bacterium]
MDTIIDILTELHPDVNFDMCDTLIDDGILDSFDIVSIIARINEEFDVQITADRITPENFNSAEAIWALVSELLDE